MAVDKVNTGHSSGLNSLKQSSLQGTNLGQSAQVQGTSANPANLSAQQQNLAAQGNTWNTMALGQGSGMTSQANFMDPNKARLQSANNPNYFGPQNGGGFTSPLDLNSSGLNPAAFSGAGTGNLASAISDLGVADLMRDPNIPPEARVVIAYMALSKQKLNRAVDDMAQGNLDNVPKDQNSGNTDQAIREMNLKSAVNDDSRTTDGGNAIIKSTHDSRKVAIQNIRS